MVSRMIIFFIILGVMGLMLILTNFQSLPVDHTKFNFDKAAESFNAKQAALEKGSEEGAKTEAPAANTNEPVKIDLNTPQLVNGEKVFGKCTACHGTTGEGKTSMKAAHIGGQYDWYIEKQLTDMKAGTRVNETMNPTLKGLTEQDIKDVAVYVSKLPWKKIN